LRRWGLFRSLLSPSRVGRSVTSPELVELFGLPDRRVRPASHDTHAITLQSVPGLIPDAFVAADRCALVHMHIVWGDGCLPRPSAAAAAASGRHTALPR